MEVVNIFYDITKNFVYGCVSFWNWFINPIVSIGDLVIAPYQIISFTALIVIFGMVLVHLINPIG